MWQTKIYPYSHLIMRLLNKLFFISFLLFISGLPFRLGFISQSVNELIIVFFAVTGMFSFSIYLSKFRYKVDMLDILLIIVLIIYPVFNSIIARITVGQPVYMGILTFRTLFILFTYYTILLMGFSERFVLSYVGSTVFFIIIIVAILFYVFSLNDFNVLVKKGSLDIEYTLTTTKGLQFSGFTCLFFIPYVSGLVKYTEKDKISYLLLPVTIFVFSILISKARNEILTMMVMPVFIYYVKYKISNIKFLIFTILLVSFFFIALTTENVLSRNLSGLVKSADIEFARETKDYSVYLRLEQYKDAWAWFKRYPLTGVGSISYRYNGGYMGFISEFFFISDIGIMGILVKGGLILLSLYVLLYIKLFNYFSGDNLYSIIGRYLVFFLIIELIIGNDFLVNYSGIMVILFLIKPARKGIPRGLN